MINPTNGVKIFGDRVSNLLSPTTSNTSTVTITTTNRECEVAELLYGVLESITNSHSHTFEVESTLDHDLADDELFNDAGDEDTTQETWDPSWNEDDEDDDKALCKQFSLDSMTTAVNFYDEINPHTGKRKRRWETAVTKCYAEGKEKIKASADQFVADVRQPLPQYQVDEVINTDQSGLQLELHSTRTLSHKGEK
ncbi:unnamed protein product, partial [Didymodactylos carnosus]